eukprot:TRINITY_DN8286_c0_g1_i1.p1 TRINITY_DN8286_c0_g1~~TRINITY_DN8286_c0_g1_i1.p1  ORF type:complete len:194 (+),score=73.60 TRINITY_DN8286_c0_g1_i1:509-1090(+)
MDNSKVHIKAGDLELVPYTEQYVEVYHAWMCREDLLELTCSEPLTLEEERRNQKEWLESGEKLTFIILVCGEPVGDCNIFLDDEGASAEVEVMIASTAHRRQGHAKQAIIHLMHYAALALPAVTTFRAKILTHNSASQALFKALGFALEREVPVFNEEHYTLSVEAARPLFEKYPCTVEGVAQNGEGADIRSS